MPVVFVHGVNNRETDADYASNKAAREAYIKGVFGPDVGMQNPTVYFPYWGDLGVKLLWQGASLPSKKATPLATGANIEASERDDWQEEVFRRYENSSTTFWELARERGFAEVIDLVWDTAAAVAETEEEHKKIAKLFNASRAYAAGNPTPSWAINSPPLTNEAFFDKLLSELAQVGGEQRALGGLDDAFESARETFSRLASAPAAEATKLVLSSMRAKLNSNASRFVGDVFEYLSSRSREQQDAPIVVRIIERLKAAEAESKQKDEPLIVIGHSLGGVITYDILKHYLTTMKVDKFISVGSQVALFAEMDQYAVKIDSKDYASPQTSRISKPENISQWLNVYDLNDMFSYATTGVFEGVSDYEFKTGYGLLAAHGGYFKRPSFYTRLVKRLKMGAGKDEV